MNEPLETQEAPEGMAPEMAEPVKKKRVTVADLQKEIDQIREDPIPKLAEWCGELDARLDKIEAGSMSNWDDVASNLNDRLDMLESTIGSGELQLRLGAEQRIEALESAMVQLAQEIRVVHEDMPAPEIPKIPELEFAKPPAQPAGGRTQAGDIESVACICQTMADVLMITRALKDSVEISDQDKIRILNVACKAAGVDDALGLRIRAGISTTGATSR